MTMHDCTCVVNYPIMCVCWSTNQIISSEISKESLKKHQRASRIFEALRECFSVSKIPWWMLDVIHRESQSHAGESQRISRIQKNEYAIYRTQSHTYMHASIVCVIACNISPRMVNRSDSWFEEIRSRLPDNQRFSVESARFGWTLILRNQSNQIELLQRLIWYRFERGRKMVVHISRVNSWSLWSSIFLFIFLFLRIQQSRTEWSVKSADMISVMIWWDRPTSIKSVDQSSRLEAVPITTFSISVSSSCSEANHLYLTIVKYKLFHGHLLYHQNEIFDNR